VNRGLPGPKLAARADARRSEEFAEKHANLSEEAWKVAESSKAGDAARRSEKQIGNPRRSNASMDACMSHEPELSPPSDVCLLLRAHAEQRWLSLEVSPVVGQLQRRDSLPEEQVGAALAYLEVLWIEASQHAAETDAVYAQMDAWERANTAGDGREQPDSLDGGGGSTLPSKARRYHAAVRTLREVLGRQVAMLLAAPGDDAGASAWASEQTFHGRWASP
jgi:hypothetical protein